MKLDNKNSKRTVVSFLSACLLSFSGLVFADTISVDNTTDLQNALNNAQPGDEIIVTAGDYVGDLSTSGNSKALFFSDKSGTASNPITLRSADKSNKQILKGNSIETGYVFYLTGDNWIIKDLKFANAQKGIMLEEANNNTIDNVELSNLGAEAVHIRYNSSDNVLSNCYIHDTGERAEQGGYGEGVYVGTHNGHEISPLDESNDNRIGGCSIGPYVRGEAFDIKSGTTGTIIESNYIDATGLFGTAKPHPTENKDVPGADSFIDLKGTDVTIRNNIMEWKGESNFEHAIFTYQEHRSSNIYDNEFNLPSSAPIYKALEAMVHNKNNTRTDAGSEITEAAYQLDNVDDVLDSSFAVPASSYVCFDELSNGCGSDPEDPTDPTDPTAPSVSASTDDGNVPENTLDGSTSSDSRWSANGLGQWIQYEFSEAVSLGALKIAFYSGDSRQSYFQIQSSDNGSTWSTLVDSQSSGSSLDFETFSFNQTSALYFRIVGQGNSNNNWNSLTEVEFVEGEVIIIPETGSCNGTQAVAWDVKTEVQLANNDCISFTNDLANEILQAWDSDTNTSCDFRGTIESIDGAVSITMDGNYESISSLSGKTFKITPSNNCQYIKVRAY
jgi:hypothetical protein